MVVLNAYFESSDFDPGPSFTRTTMTNTYLEFLIFTGQLNAFLLVRLFVYYLIFVFVPTALLICMENTFWNVTKDGGFVELFEKSFTSYVENGMMQLVETDIDILRDEQGGFSPRVTKDFNAKFYKFIVDHFLRKLLSFIVSICTRHI